MFIIPLVEICYSVIIIFRKQIFIEIGKLEVGKNAQKEIDERERERSVSFSFGADCMPIPPREEDSTLAQEEDSTLVRETASTLVREEASTLVREAASTSKRKEASTLEREEDSDDSFGSGDESDIF